ncbi:MAG: response regulator [Alphaproteobacteria bacterium]|nr:response regulator [Alphaproteobacteria bacterium]
MNETVNKQINWDAITCLVVDDDKFSRTFVKTALYQIGIKNTKEAATTAEAAEILRSYKINVVLLDHQMPEQTGLELARKIKDGSIGDDKDLPIIMVTVDTKEKTVLDAKSIGIHEYLVKPISPLALKKRICTAFGIKER